jgi:succinoglycan biosynthesis protein ExoW
MVELTALFSTAPGFPWKIVVVDNATPTNPSKSSQDIETSFPLEILNEPTPEMNHVINRQLYIERDLIVVTDDAIPQTGFLQFWRDGSLRRPDHDIFGGSVEPHFEVVPPMWMSRRRENFGELFAGRRLPNGPINPFGICGPNMAVRRLVFDAGLKFDEAIGQNSSDSSYPMGNVNEFCFRARLDYSTWFVCPRRRCCISCGAINLRQVIGRNEPTVSAAAWRTFTSSSPSNPKVNKGASSSSSNAEGNDSKRASSSPSNAEVKVAVIIPYYQKEPRILNACLQSIFAQQFTSAVHVHLIVVDDSSPLPPEHDILKMHVPSSFELQIVKRENGGPGAARNTGLDHIPDDTQYVAFIDSDDHWAPDHLARAIANLEKGYDLYFCDHHDLQHTKSHFELLQEAAGSSALGCCGIPDGFVTYKGQLSIKRIDGMDSFSFKDQEGLNALIKYFLAHISTVVLRYQVLGQMRFNLALRVAEDYLFLLQLASKTNRICFSNKIGMHRGRGISLYMSAIAWDSKDNLSNILDELRCFVIASRLPSLPIRAKHLIRHRIALGRAQFMFLWTRRLVKFRRVEMRTLLNAICADPALFVVPPAILRRAIFSRGSIMDPRLLAKL